MSCFVDEVNDVNELVHNVDIDPKTNYDDFVADSIIEFITGKEVQHLNINNCLTSGFGHHLERILVRCENIVSLDLSNNRLCDGFIFFLANILPKITSIKILNLTNNRITSGALSFLKYGLCNNTSLTHINLSYNPINSANMELFMRGMIQSVNIKSLNLSEISNQDPNLLPSFIELVNNSTIETITFGSKTGLCLTYRRKPTNSHKYLCIMCDRCDTSTIKILVESINKITNVDDLKLELHCTSDNPMENFIDKISQPSLKNIMIWHKCMNAREYAGEYAGEYAEKSLIDFLSKNKQLESFYFRSQNPSIYIKSYDTNDDSNELFGYLTNNQTNIRHLAIKYIVNDDTILSLSNFIKTNTIESLMIDCHPSITLDCAKNFLSSVEGNTSIKKLIILGVTYCQKLIDAIAQLIKNNDCLESLCIYQKTYVQTNVLDIRLLCDSLGDNYRLLHFDMNMYQGFSSPRFIYTGNDSNSTYDYLSKLFTKDISQLINDNISTQSENTTQIEKYIARNINNNNSKRFHYVKAIVAN